MFNPNSDNGYIYILWTLKVTATLKHMIFNIFLFSNVEQWNFNIFRADFVFFHSITVEHSITVMFPMILVFKTDSM